MTETERIILMALESAAIAVCLVILVILFSILRQIRGIRRMLKP